MPSTHLFCAKCYKTAWIFLSGAFIWRRLPGAGGRLPGLKGSSGYAELGVRIQPTDAEFYIDLSACGLVGVQEGVGGNLSLKYTF